MPIIFAQENDLVQQCINNSQATKSYHTEIYFRDLLDKKTEDKNYNSIEWEIDCVKPDRIYVKQMALTDGSADVWIAIKNRIFRFFGAWIETTGKSESDTLDFHSFLLLDKFLELLHHNKPISQSQDDNLIVLGYSPKNWDSFAKSWQLQDWYACDTKIWIDPRNNLIQKAHVTVNGKDKKGTEYKFEVTQVFTNYNGEIRIEEPKTVNVKTKSGISKELINELK